MDDTTNTKELQMAKISEEAVLNIMKAHFQGSGIGEDGSFTEYTGSPETFLSFARVWFSDGYINGIWDCQQIFTQNREK